MIKISYLHDYLKQLHKLTKSDFHKWCLTKGKIVPISDKNGDFVKKYGLGLQKQCYYNAQMATVNSNGKIKYYEGWYLTDIGLPFEHGFNAVKGKAIDCTSRFKVKEYFGINIPLKFIRNNMVNTGFAESLLLKYYRKR